MKSAFKTYKGDRCRYPELRSTRAIHDPEPELEPSVSGGGGRAIGLSLFSVSLSYCRQLSLRKDSHDIPLYYAELEAPPVAVSLIFQLLIY